MFEYETEEPGIILEGPGMRGFNNVFIDVDSCLAGIEGIDMLAEMHGVAEEVKPFTNLAMNGEITMQEAFERRLDLIKPDASDLMVVANAYLETVTPDAIETIRVLQSLGINVQLISGGYDGAILPLARLAGIPDGNLHANKLFFDYQGKYAGFDSRNPLWQTGGKGLVIKQLKDGGKIWGQTAIVGDGVSEVETKPITDFRIGFGGHVRRDPVVLGADVFINQNTFAPLLPLLISRTDVDHILLFRPELRHALKKGFDSIEAVDFNRPARTLERHLARTISEIPIERFDPDIPAIKESDG